MLKFPTSSEAAERQVDAPRGSANFDLQKVSCETRPRVASNDLFDTLTDRSIRLFVRRHGECSRQQSAFHVPELNCRVDAAC